LSEMRSAVQKLCGWCVWMRRMPRVRLDKYARDARAWQDFARVNYGASLALFATKDPFLYLPAATLAHHALEMYLKAALICEGMTVFDPRKRRSLDRALRLMKSECVWGHELKKSARRLAAKRSDFDLSAPLNVTGCAALQMPMKLGAAFELFDPFFSELRYPQELKKLEGLGEDEKLVLDNLVRALEPFLPKESR